MRIGLVVHDYDRTGGHSRYTVELATRFARDHEVHVFANTCREPLPPGARFHRVPALRATALTTVLSFAASRPARGTALDIVHAQGFCGARADVVTAHICAARWLETRRQADGHATLKDRLFGAAVVPLERRTFSDPATTVIAVSQLVAGDLRAYYGRHGETPVVPHGVDTQQFSPERTRELRDGARTLYGADRDTPVLLFVGDARKGARHLLEAAARVPDVRVLIVTRSDCRPLLACAEALGLTGRVTVAGPTSSIEVAYAAADMFVFPTPYDAFGMVVTEAMACGLPTITTRQAGASELMRDGIDGMLLAHHDDVEACSAAIASLVKDPARRQQMGAAAARAAARFTWDQVAQKTLALYERTIAERRTHAA